MVTRVAGQRRGRADSEGGRSAGCLTLYLPGDKNRTGDENRIQTPFTGRLEERVPRLAGMMGWFPAFAGMTRISRE